MEPELGCEAAGTAQLPMCTAQLPAQRHPRRPSTLHMVTEALQALQVQNPRKGVSVVAIKRFILSKHPYVDPIRLKYLLKQALSKGLSRGNLVRPHSSSATGATGSFKLAPKTQQKKQAPGQADTDGGQAPKPGHKGATKALRAPTAGEKQQGTRHEQAAAAKKPKAKPPAAGKSRSNGAKPSQTAGHPQAQGKSRSRPPVAAAAEDTGWGHDTTPMGAGARDPHRPPVGQSKGKASKAAQRDAPEAKGSKARKPQATPGAGKGGKAAPKATGRKAP